MEEEIIVEILDHHIRGSCFISPPGTILLRRRQYPAKTNQHGAVSGLCDNGQWLGLKPGEFKFIKAPDWLLKIHGICPHCFREGITEEVEIPDPQQKLTEGFC